MKLQPIDDARTVWHRLWSVRLSLVASVLGAVSAALPFVAPAGSDWRFALLTGSVTLAASLTSLAAAGARLVRQPSLTGDDDVGGDDVR